jgi:hypothetical protein
MVRSLDKLPFFYKVICKSYFRQIYNGTGNNMKKLIPLLIILSFTIENAGYSFLESIRLRSVLTPGFSRGEPCRVKLRAYTLPEGTLRPPSAASSLKQQNNHTSEYKEMLLMLNSLAGRIKFDYDKEKTCYENLRKRLIEKNYPEPEKIIELLKKIMQNRNVITGKDFLRTLEQVRPDLNRVLNESNSYAVIWGHPHSSRRWTWLLMENGIERKPALTSYFSSEGQEVPFDDRLLKMSTYVIVDDAVYSGNQIIQTIEQLCSRKRHAKIIVSAPYMTDLAVRRIKSAVKKIKSHSISPSDISVIILPHKKMPVLREILTPEEHDLLPLLESFLGGVFIDGKRYDLLNTTVTLFEHKIADVYSVCRYAIRYLGRVLEPYKDKESNYYKNETLDYQQFIKVSSSGSKKGFVADTRFNTPVFINTNHLYASRDSAYIRGHQQMAFDLIEEANAQELTKPEPVFTNNQLRVVLVGALLEVCLKYEFVENILLREEMKSPEHTAEVLISFDTTASLRSKVNPIDIFSDKFVMHEQPSSHALPLELLSYLKPLRQFNVNFRIYNPEGEVECEEIFDDLGGIKVTIRLFTDKGDLIDYLRKTVFQANDYKLVDNIETEMQRSSKTAISENTNNVSTPIQNLSTMLVRAIESAA